MAPVDRVLGLELALGLALVVGCEGPRANEDSVVDSSSSESSSAGSSSSGETEEAEEADAPDSLPPVPALASPSDGASEVALETSLCWELVEDPDGEPVRYRVSIDGMTLSNGVLGDAEGYAGPCVGPLLFAHEREYHWAVEAFEVDDPNRSSGPSETWSFRTVGDGLSEQVFADDFEDDQGWTVDGDAFAGAWVLGDPIAASDGDQPSQPGVCAAGTSCWFTGQNPNGLADDEDVSGGATTLTSPAFDLSGAAAATIRLERFFYRSALMPDPDAAFTVELLTPNDLAVGGYDAHLLELLDQPSTSLAANAWTPREYPACGLPMLANSRLRITARDLGSGVLEAAIDSVSVHAWDDASFCTPGLGGACDPTLGDAACPDSLLCCTQGVVDLGVHRCEAPVPGLDYQNPPANPGDPGNGPLGCDAADLIIEPAFLEPIFTDIFMSDDSCELLEGCVGEVGWRTVMLFTVATPNVGSRDLALGVPANLPDLFHYSECHDHHHFDEFARYELRDGDVVVATGHKQAFCLLDTTSWAWPLAFRQFDCANQGISRGFSDFYEAGLPCQWVDITGVAPGEYTLRIALNQPRPEHANPALVERDYSNNVVELSVLIP